MELVPLKVTIRYGEKEGRKQYTYPDFDRVSPENRKNMQWIYYVDLFGGWNYCIVSPMHKHTAEAGLNVTHGMILVEPEFAAEADAMFDDVEVMSGAAAREFYESRATAAQPEQYTDTDALIAIKARRDLGLPDSPEIVKALNPEDDQPGIRRNKQKKFAEMLASKGITIKKTNRRG